MNKSQEKIKRIAELAILSSLVVVFQIIGNFIQIGPASINLSLIPVTIGAVLYGPLAGLFLGFVNGLAVLPFAEYFFSISIFGTILICISKCSIAGFISGLVYKMFKKRKEAISIVLSSLVVPIVNTSVFVLGSLIFFKSALTSMMSTVNASNIFLACILGFVGVNFFVELGLTIILSPAIIYIIKLRQNKQING